MHATHLDKLIKKTHKPVFLEAVNEFFSPLKINCFVDATLGAGGHSWQILNDHPEITCFIGIDRDCAALENAREYLNPLLKNKQSHFIHSDFLQGASELAPIIEQQGGCQGILLDIGVSSMQLDQKERGFSFRQDGPLDMRMDQSLALSAYEIVNQWSFAQLEKIFREYGEEPKARLAAQMICQRRQKKTLHSTHELTHALEGLWLNSRNHPCTRIFQALRIAVNGELDQLELALPLWLDQLQAPARLGVICFHSLEDRIAKNILRDRSKLNHWQLLTSKPLVTSEKERRHNPRSRSAKLRFIEKSLMD